VGENGESHHKVPYTPKVILGKKKKMMLALPCYIKKREKKESYKEGRKKGLKKEREKYMRYIQKIYMRYI
jgi:hypothetical protein